MTVVRNRKKADEDIKEQPNRDANEDLLKCLAENLAQLKDKKLTYNVKRIQELESFRSAESTLNRLYYSRPRSLLDKFYDNWDIGLLLLLNFIFAFYLGFFMLAFIAPENEHSIQFYEVHENAYAAAVKQWFHLMGNDQEDIASEECAVPIPTFIAPILRPIDPCDMCTGLTEIKRVEKLSKQEFLEKYAYTAVPVIVTGKIHINENTALYWLTKIVSLKKSNNKNSYLKPFHFYLTGNSRLLLDK